MQATARSREALIESGALVRARRPQNLLDVRAAPVRDRKRNLSDVLDEMREEQ